LKRAVCLSFAVLSLGCMALSPGAQAQAGNKPYYLEMNASSKLDNRARNETVKVWFKDATKFRMERSNGTQSVVTLANGTDAWVFNPAQKKGHHTHLTPDAVAKLVKQTHGAGDVYKEFIKAGGKKTGTEKVGGVLCNVYRFTDKEGLRHVLWVLPGSDNLSRRMKIDGVVRAAAAMGQPMQTHIIESLTDFTKWEVGKNIEEGMFRPPAGIAFEEAPSNTGSPAPQRKK
jgi:outer membrane lipoprotein-sorting protein